MKLQQLSRAAVKLGPNSTIIDATKKTIGYKPATNGRNDANTAGFTFIPYVNFADDLKWNTADRTDGDYDLIARLQNGHDWEDTFNPNFTGNGGSINTNEKWLKFKSTWFNFGNSINDNRGKVIIDNARPTVDTATVTPK